MQVKWSVKTLLMRCYLSKGVNELPEQAIWEEHLKEGCERAKALRWHLRGMLKECRMMTWLEQSELLGDWPVTGVRGHRGQTVKARGHRKEFGFYFERKGSH